jgi:mRNA interferase YafQ
MPSVRKLVLSKAFEKSYQKFTSKNQALKTSIGKALLKLHHDAYDPALRTHKLSGKLAAYLAVPVDMTAESSSLLKKIFLIQK